MYVDTGTPMQAVAQTCSSTQLLLQVVGQTTAVVHHRQDSNTLWPRSQHELTLWGA